MEMCHFKMWNLNNNKKRKKKIHFPESSAKGPSQQQYQLPEHAITSYGLHTQIDRMSCTDCHCRWWLLLFKSFFRYIAAEVLPYSFYFIILLNRVDMSTSMQNKNKHFTVVVFNGWKTWMKIFNKKIYKNTQGTRMRYSQSSYGRFRFDFVSRDIKCTSFHFMWKSINWIGSFCPNDDKKKIFQEHFTSNENF